MYCVSGTRKNKFFGTSVAHATDKTSYVWYYVDSKGTQQTRIKLMYTKMKMKKVYEIDTWGNKEELNKISVNYKAVLSA